MACGVPLITTSGGALPEVVGDAAMIVPPADAAALTKAIAFLFNNSDQRKKYSQAGLERVNSVFSWPKAAQEVVDVYREAIDGHCRFS
jgi:glycosyltransferase involved in cell wall biosynthesis